MRFLKNGRASWQRVWETEIGTTVQNDKETVTRHYVVDYLSIANRDIFVTEDGSYTTRYVYDAGGRRISAEFDYAPGTKRGEPGENLQSDIAAEIGKVFYRTSILGSTLFVVDKNGEVIAHAIYDPWGKPLTETYTDANYSGLENLNNYTGYTYDLTLALYFAQNRFYDADTHRFTQEDSAQDGTNWYVYCGNGPLLNCDLYGLLVGKNIRGQFGLIPDGFYAIMDLSPYDGNIVYYKEHQKKGTTSPSNRNKHEEGQSRKQSDNGGEKGDARRKPNPNKRRIESPQSTGIFEKVVCAGMIVVGVAGIAYLIGNDVTGIGAADDVVIVPVLELIKQGFQIILS